MVSGELCEICKGATAQNKGLKIGQSCATIKIGFQAVLFCCGIAGVAVLCSADCCRPMCPAG